MQSTIYYKNKKFKITSVTIQQKYSSLTYEKMQKCNENKADFASFLSFKAFIIFNLSK